MQFLLNTLIIFTRFPEPGRTKTRLIPSLGPERAACLQEVMTGRTVLMARCWAAAFQGSITLRTTGAKERAFRNWLGTNLNIMDQNNGDLGDRMREAANNAFQQGASRVALIGCDCPVLSPAILQHAFDALATHDVAIGPARDGGYYLIAFKQTHACLFEQISWGTSAVCDQTRTAARANGLSVAMLESLQDVDEPGDVKEWERYVTPNDTISLSVIIPALEEASRIESAIQSALPGAGEVIIADGGSSDDTITRAESAGARVFRAPRGRARQLNAGAWEARGTYLLFLHGDCRLPEKYAAHLARALKKHVAGAFHFAIDHPDRRYRVIEWGVRQRCRLWGVPYGDQGLFTKRETFWRTGGYSDMPIMEDYEWAHRMKRRGEFALLDQPLYASARRWQTRGLVATTLINQGIILGSTLGIPHDKLASWYRRG